jgi:hypothetical protein
LFEKAFVFKAQQKRQTVRLTTGDLPSWGIEQALSVGEVWNRLAFRFLTIHIWLSRIFKRS